MEIYKFETKAMNAELNLSICAEAHNYAKSAAHDLFEYLKSIDETLSMFFESSDISMINAIETGKVAKVLEITVEALAGAMYAANLSKGAVNVCMGEFFLQAKNKQKIENPQCMQLEINPDEYAIKKLSAGKIDLGAIGKGFALELLAQKLTEMWGLNRAHFNFGGSSQLALNAPEGKDAWDITFAGQTIENFKFTNCAIGGSGTAIQGEHILDCRTMKAPETHPLRAWAICDSAMLADAMSTAFMVLAKEEIAAICEAENIRAILQNSESEPFEFIGWH